MNDRSRAVSRVKTGAAVESVETPDPRPGYYSAARALIKGKVLILAPIFRIKTPLRIARIKPFVVVSFESLDFVLKLCVKNNR